MPFHLVFSSRARNELRDLEFDEDRKDLARLLKVRHGLARLENNPRHSSLRTHEFRSMLGENGEKVWEVYVDLPWRLFWHYGPNPNQITVVAITPQP